MGIKWELVLHTVLTGATIALAVYTYMLWYDTHRLVIDAEKTTKKQSAYMDTSLKLTKQLSDAASVAAKAAQASAEAAVSANRLLRDNSIIEHRPWITADISIISPLTWGSDGGTITLRFALRNVGHSPALDVFPFPEIRLGPPLDYKAELKKISENALELKNELGGLGAIIFPGDTSTWNYTMTIANSEIEKWRSSMGSKNAGIWPNILGCVRYKLVIGGEYHQTGFNLKLLRKEPDKPGGSLVIIPEDGNVPLSNLQLIPEMQFGITD